MGLGLVDRAWEYGDAPAIVDSEGSHTYLDLLDVSEQLAAAILRDREDLAEGRVAFLVPPGFDYVAWQWAIWRAGGMAAPMCLTHTPPEFAFVLDDARPDTVVSHPDFADRLGSFAADRTIRLLSSVDGRAGRPPRLPALESRRRAMMLYTSGTTGQPKGVVSTHHVIEAQIRSLVSAWGWTSADRVLLVLPLHHVHGIINVVSCALWSGAVCEMHPRFEAVPTWERLASGELTLFMAVPTIYHRLIEAWEVADLPTQERWSRGSRRLRLMVSGSAALPVSTLERWRSITGHTLLERYGMTEIGMALSNPLEGERLPGHVGSPLPGVEVRLVDEADRASPDDTPGEIQVRGETVFLEYWDRSDATGEAFVDGWFRTGDVAVRHDGVYRILGRASVDIIKTGGEKVSALEVEEVLLGHDSVREVAVVGLPDERWGERVVAAVVLARRGETDPEELRAHCQVALAPYKVPKSIHFLEALPRNALGKVTKPAIVTLLTGVKASPEGQGADS